MADPDDTIRLPRPGQIPPKRPAAVAAASVAAPKRRLGLVVVLVVLVLAAVAGAGGVVWLVERPGANASSTAMAPAPQPAAATQAAAPAVPAIPALSEAEILARSPAQTEVYRFAPQPAIIVIVFGSFAAQADMLNRAAALIEKGGFPHDRVVDMSEVDRRARAEGGTFETLYYGHDYAAGDILRFLDLLDKSGIPPTDGEKALRRMTTDWGWKPGTNGAIITLAQDAGTHFMDAAGRATILRHELSHGMFFTSPAYADYARHFFQDVLSDGDRTRFKLFLSNEGYDTMLDTLVINETQAYLVHTADQRFFSASAVGIDQARVDKLRAQFLAGMPPGWLRDAASAPGGTQQ